MTATGKGFTATAAVCVIWGVFPLYFHLLHRVSPFQVIAHRVVWSCAFVLCWMAVRGELPSLRAALAERSVVWRLAVTATLITLNWMVYVWAVMNGHVV